jgi:hypothetical protein
MNKHVPTFMTGLGAGAAAVLLLDPEHGTARRRLVRDKTLEGIETARRATAATRELGSRLAEFERSLLAVWQGPKGEGNGWSPARLALAGVGALTVGFVASRGVMHRRRAISEVSVPRDNWREFLDGFTHRHRRRFANVEVHGQGPVNGAISRELPLIAVSIDGGSAIVSAGEQPDAHISHVIPDVEAIAVERHGDGAECGLRIRSGDGTSTLIRFRSALKPKQFRKS